MSLSKLFHIVTDAQVITRKNGVFDQVHMYQRQGEMYIKKGGYIRLKSEGRTSVPSLMWLDMELPKSFKYGVAEHGYLVMVG